MNKTELIEAVAAKAAISKKDADTAISAVVDVIVESVSKGEKVQLVGFGTFEARRRAAKTGRNPKTMESISIPATTVPVFKAGKSFKDTVGK